MSDENEHEHQHGLPIAMFQMGPSPEEVETAKLTAMANSHDTRDWMNGLSERDLMKLITLVRTVMGDAYAGMYFIGLIGQMLDLKFNKCVTCGNDHDNPFPDEMHGEAEKEPIEAHPDPDAPPVKGTKKYDELMYLYGMEQDDDGSDRVMCKNCTQWYINLADRMLRKAGPEGCAGCIQKTKWGG